MTPEQVDARRKEIRRELRSIKRNPTADGAAQRAQRLSAEYRRLSRPQTPGPSAPVAPVTGLTEEESAAVATWPSELRARVNDAALSRVIVPWGRG